MRCMHKEEEILQASEHKPAFSSFGEIIFRAESYFMPEFNLQRDFYDRVIDGTHSANVRCSQAIFF